MLHEFLAASTPEIIARTRAKVAARTTPMPTEAALSKGVPLFLGQLIDRLRRATTDSTAIEESAAAHGAELLAMGFTVSQVVHGYGDVCQVVTQMADETNAPITTHEFNTLNRCLDDAIAYSVTEFERRRDESLAYDGTVRLGILAHELRNRLTAATLAFSVLQEGTVGVSGATGAVLGRSLRALRVLVDNALATVRFESGLHEKTRVPLAEVIQQVQAEAAIGVEIGGVGLAVAPVAKDADVEADPLILSAAISNLLQNAFKFSCHGGLVSLRTTASSDRVLIEVEDQCGGLPPGKPEELFRPFQQRSAKRTGLGLGLSISRRSIEAMGGTMVVRDLPGKGCVFSIELPRLPQA
jgi:signal transduction histidine kinase